jgi:hypothetical protein
MATAHNDRMLPQLEGAEVYRRLREAGLAMPMLMLPAKEETDDWVDGVDASAETVNGNTLQSHSPEPSSRTNAADPSPGWSFNA